jgi:hypothetical protein
MSELFTYFLMFLVIGLVIGHLVKDQKQASLISIVAAVLWGMSSRFIWGLVTLGELLLGYFAYSAFLADKIGRSNVQDADSLSLSNYAH